MKTKAGLFINRFLELIKSGIWARFSISKEVKICIEGARMVE
jgi:hypothetical protein